MPSRPDRRDFICAVVAGFIGLFSPEKLHGQQAHASKDYFDHHTVTLTTVDKEKIFPSGIFQGTLQRFQELDLKGPYEKAIHQVSEGNPEFLYHMKRLNINLEQVANELQNNSFSFLKYHANIWSHQSLRNGDVGVLVTSTLRREGQDYDITFGLSARRQGMRAGLSELLYYKIATHGKDPRYEYIRSGSKEEHRFEQLHYSPPKISPLVKGVRLYEEPGTGLMYALDPTGVLPKLIKGLAWQEIPKVGYT